MICGHFNTFTHDLNTCMRAKSLQPCPILCDPMNCVARQAPLSMGFSRQGYCSGLPFPSPGDLPNTGIEPQSPALQADSLLTELQLPWNVGSSV